MSNFQVTHEILLNILVYLFTILTFVRKVEMYQIYFFIHFDNILVMFRSFVTCSI